MQDLAYLATTRAAVILAASDLDLTQAGRFLDQAVLANPQDLRAHLQRIHFYWQGRKQDAAFAALVDMFFILGNAGIEIRKRLLRNCQGLLSREQQVFLIQYLDDGLGEGLDLPAGSRTVLYKNCVKTRSGDSDEVIDDPSSENEPVPFLLAQEYRRRGWDDLAKGLLQELVTAEPDNAVARRTLLQLP